MQQGRVVRSQTDYILVSDRQIFQNVAFQDPRHIFNRFVDLGCLCRASLKGHYSYLGRRARLPLHPPSCQTRTRADKLFDELRRAVPKPDKRTERHNLWISNETWRLVDERVSTRP